MAIYHQKITIITVRKPAHGSINEELQWLGTSLGLFNPRDKDKSLFRIFIELLKSAKKREQLTSDEIAYKLGLSRGTVIHHIDKLVDAGIVIHQKNKYMLRVDNLKMLIDEVEKDIKRTCDDLRAIADQIDKRLEL